MKGELVDPNTTVFNRYTSNLLSGSVGSGSQRNLVKSPAPSLAFIQANM